MGQPVLMWPADDGAAWQRAQHRPLARIAARMTYEFLLDAAREITRMGEGNFDLGVVLISLLQTGGASGGDHEGPSPGLTVSGLATSFGRPFETIRRHVNTLIQRGLCVRTPSGITMPAAALGDPALVGSMIALHDLTVRLAEDLARVGYPLPPTIAGTPPFDLIARTGIDLFVCALDFAAPRHEDWTSMVLFAAVMTANARSFNFDPVLTWRYSEMTTPPPEQIRRPVSARILSRALAMPYPTLRRHLARLEEEGRIVRRVGGYLIPTEWLQKPDQMAVSDYLSQRLAILFGRLAQAGFPFDDPASRYCHARPPLTDFS